MKLHKENISTLIVNKIKGTISDCESAELDAWINASSENKILYEKLLSESWFEEKATLHSTIDPQRAKRQMQAKIAGRTRTLRVKRFSIAASIAVVALCTSLFLTQNTEKLPITSELPQQKGYKALLTLDDGTEVKIGGDEASGSDVNHSDSILIEKDQINYTNIKIQRSTINKLYVSRTENFSIVLNDGTRVWLNSETELKYPTQFTGATREVFLSGEAYFEVKKSTIPFVVKTANSSIKVLGTCFNVSCYCDEQELTTLTEGRVELKNSKSNRAVILNPGMQGVICKCSPDIEVKTVDPEIYSAWRSGVIHFENETLEDIMKNISRWYDVEVEYGSDQLKTLHFYIKMTKDDSISEFIRIIELTQIVTCRQEGNKIIITDFKK